MDQKGPMSERCSKGFVEHGSTLAERTSLAREVSTGDQVFYTDSELRSFPIIDTIFQEFSDSWGRLFLLTFFGEAKKVSGRRATPGLLNSNNFRRQFKTESHPV